MKRRYVVRIEYEVTYDEKATTPGAATKYLREQMESYPCHDGFQTGDGGMYFTSKGKPTVRVITR